MNDMPTPPTPNGAVKVLRLVMGGVSFLAGIGLFVADHLGILPKPPDWKLTIGLIVGGFVGADFTWDKIETLVHVLKIWKRPNDK